MVVEHILRVYSTYRVSHKISAASNHLPLCAHAEGAFILNTQAKTLVKLKNFAKYINAVVREIYIVHLDAKVLILIDGALFGHNLQW